MSLLSFLRERKGSDHHAAFVYSLSTSEAFDQCSQNVVRTLCHWRPPRPHTLSFFTIGCNGMTDSQTCEVEVMVVLLNLGVLKLCMVFDHKKYINLLLFL